MRRYLASISSATFRQIIQAISSFIELVSAVIVKLLLRKTLQDLVSEFIAQIRN